MNSWLRTAAIAVVLLIALPAGASLPASTTPEDIGRIAYVSAATISHRGTRVAFVVTRLDVPQNRYRRNLWLVNADGTGLMQLTRGDGDLEPQWSPDDRTIAFTGTRGDTSQIYTIAVDGGEARRLTSETKGASNPRWSHNGRYLLYGATFQDPPHKTRFDAAAAGAPLDAKHADSDVRVTDRLDFEENGSGESFTRHVHLIRMRTDGSARVQLTPMTPYAEKDAAWSYDDRTIAFVTLRRPVDPARLDADIYTMPAAGGPLRRVVLRARNNAAPAWSHDGRTLYVTVMSRNDPSALPGIDAARLAGAGERRVVAENQVAFGDAMLSDTKEGGAGCGPLLEPHDRWFLAGVSVPGGTALERFDAVTGHATAIVARGDEVADCTMDDAATRVAFTASDVTHPGEIYVHDLRSGATRRLTLLNAAYEARTRLVRAQPLAVRDEAGFAVQAWFLPASVPRGTRAPTLLEIHGGPAGEFGNTFFHEMQMLAGRGYNVVYANPRGSVGYGYRFTAALAKDWGDPMFRDEMAVMDAIAKRPDVDTHRLGVLGGSYGGYATLWVIGHTRRFKAAVAERVVSNMTSSFLACDECAFSSTTYSFGNPWDHQADYWHQSPVRAIANVRTPLLLLHSDEDTRTPLVDSDQWFTLAKSLHQTITYVQVPRENHDLSRTGEPVHRVERLHLIADWFAKEL
jgi:dipeptidyl aminopeptidase/acylaminoacyl peptidase